VQVALGLVFDPRYKDFPFAPLTASIVPVAVLALWSRTGASGQGLAERLAAATLALSAVYIFFNESVANWQSVWLCLLLLLLSLSLVRFRFAAAARN
jgi:glucan 1,3-beta-glucosidase